MNDKNIGISENRLHHLLGVAKKCYELAKERGHNEEFCRKMFLLGFVHDAGYEFSKSTKEHEEISAQMLQYLGLDENSHEVQAIKHHNSFLSRSNEEWLILVEADMTTDNAGNPISVMARLDSIQDIYGDYSEEYEHACELCSQVGIYNPGEATKR